MGGGEVLSYLLAWVERASPMPPITASAALATGGRIAADRFFCGGRWDAGLLAEMAAASDAG